MRVLVTGGAGYIGAVIGRKLVTVGHHVICFDDFSSGHKNQLSPHFEVVEGSLLDTKLATALSGVDAVIHCAGKSLVAESVEKPDLYRRVNVDGSRNLIESMRDVGVKRIVFSSSAAVYTGSAEPITEESEESPKNPYGETKLTVDKMLRSSGLSGASLRYFNVAGAMADGKRWIGERHTPETHLIPNLLAATTENPFTLFGDDYETPDGSCVRDYVHVEDLAEAHIAALNLDTFEIFNLGTGHGYSVKNVMASAEKILGRPIPHRVVGRRAGDPAALVASYEKAKEKLGWQPKRGLDEMISSAAAFTAQLS